MNERAHEVVPPVSSRHRRRLNHSATTLETLIVSIRTCLALWWRSGEVLRVGVGGRRRRGGGGGCCLTESLLDFSVGESFGSEKVESERRTKG